MAALSDSRASEGETRFGTSRPGIQGMVGIETGGGHDSPALLALESVDSNGDKAINYLWVDGSGDLRIHTSKPSDQDSDGTIVGTQS